MNKIDSKEIMLFKENIIDKIKHFFKNIFSKKTNKKVEEETIKKEEKDSFISRVKIEEDNEEKRLLKLQTLIGEEIITEEELPEEDIKLLHELYDKQILELKKSIDEYREKIIKLRIG